MKCYYCKRELHAGQINRAFRHNTCHSCYMKILSGELEKPKSLARERCEQMKALK